jgi:hypothetical protein
MSWKVWSADRIFPILPPFSFSPEVPIIFHFSIAVLSLIGLAVIFFFPKNIQLIFTVFILELIACFLDQMRWQPWEYKYLLIFMFYIFYYKNQKQFIWLCMILMISIYFFSGIFKLNGAFLNQIWERMILNRFFEIPSHFNSNPVIHYLGLIFPLFEISVAFGLLLSKYKRTFLLLAILSHIFVLIFLGPLGLNYNQIVWPWNILMIAMGFLLFFSSVKIEMNELFKYKFNVVIVTIITILPFLNFFEIWDDYLSFELYSGKTKKMIICIDNPGIYPELNQFLNKKESRVNCNNSNNIDVLSMTFNELNVPIYPEIRTFEIVKKRWIKKYPNLKSTYWYYHYPFKVNDIKEIK